MFRKWNRFLAFLLSIALVITTFGSDLATAKVYAEEGEIMTEEVAEPEEEPAPEIFEEIPEEEEVVEEVVPPAVEEPEEVIDGVDEEAGEEDPENPEGEDPENPEDEEKDPEEEPKEAEGEEKIVTVTYESGFGGSVSKESESVDINKEDAAFEGATATPWNDKYTFANWTKDGEVVSEEATFVPAGIEEDTTFKANFKAAENIGEEMPSINKSVTTGGMNVSVSAPEGLFPKGTTVSIEAIGDDEALATAQEAIPAATSAKGVDITFRDADGNEIQPANNKYVSVTMSLAEALEGDSFAVVHDHGDVETIGANISTDGEGNATGATFASGEFSVFIVASVDSEDDLLRKVEHYRFEEYKDGEWKEVSMQSITSGDELVSPGIPTLSKTQQFIGWFFYDKDSDTWGSEVSFGAKDVITPNAEYLVRAKVDTIYYVTLIGAKGEVVAVKSASGIEGGSADVTLDISIQPEKDTQNFTGWKNLANETFNDGATIDASDDNNRTLTAVIEEGFWVIFDENDGENGGASYTPPQFVVVKPGQNSYATEPSNDPTRNGYDFDGWYADKNCTTSFDFANTPITDKTYIYAGWKLGKAPFTVIIWKQNINAHKDAAFNSADYDFDSQFVVTGHDVDTTIEDSWLGDALSKEFKGFTYNKKEITNSGKISADGDTVVNVYYNRNRITYKFYTASNHQNTENGVYVWGISAYNNPKEMTGLYGQPLSKYGYTWPSARDWYFAEQRGNYYLLGIHETFLSQFTEDSTSFYSYANNTGKYTVNHYKQNIDGTTYPSEPTNFTKGGGHGTWYFSNKYDGFTVKSYSTDNVNFTNTSDGEHVDYGSMYNPTNLYIHYERNKYNFTVQSIIAAIDPVTHQVVPANTPQDLKVYTGILYESSLESYETDARNVAKNATAPRAGYVPLKDTNGNVGLWKDPAGTAPFDFSTTIPANNDTRAYVVWVKADFHVYFDLNVDGDKDSSTTTGYDEVNCNGQPLDLWMWYGDKVDRDTVMTKFVRDGYTLVGWFVKDTDKPYDYGAVMKDEYLYAKWRKQGGVTIKYEENGTAIKKDGTREDVAGTMLDSNRDKNTYAADSTVVVTAGSTATEEGYTFIAWELLDKNGDVSILRYPNSHFEIVDDLITDDNEVVLRALYAKTGAGTDALYTKLVYNANYEGGKEVEITKVGEDNHRLRVYEAVKAWTLDDATNNGFVREGYELVGWNINQAKANEGEIKIDLGKEYIMANNEGTTANPATNTLYAVWKQLNGTYKVNYYKDSVADANFLGSSDEFSVKIGTEIVLADEAIEGKQPSINAEKPAGYNEGVQQDPVPYEVKADSDTPQIINVVYEAATLTIFVSGMGEEEFDYDGSEHTVKGFKVERTTGGDAMAFEDKVTYDGKGKDEANPASATDVPGTEELKFDLGKFAYTGNDYLPENVTFEFETTTNEEGNAVTVDFNKVTINKAKLEIMVTGNNDTLEFNGKEQKVTGFVLSSSNDDLFDESKVLFNGVDATTDEAQESAIAKGTYVNDEKNTEFPDKYPMNLKEDGSQFTYDDDNIDATFIVENGYLIITHRENKYKVKITSIDVESVYNGYEQSYTLLAGVDAPKSTNPVQDTISAILEKIGSWFTIEADAADGEQAKEIDGVEYTFQNLSVTAARKDVGSTGFTLDSEDGVKVSLDGKDVTDEFDITVELGTLTIKKATLTVTADNKSKVVNTADPELTATVTGLVGEDIAIKAEYEEMLKDYYALTRETGETVRSYVIYNNKKENAPEIKNYDVVLVNGTFTITGTTPPPGPPTPPTPPTPPVTPPAPPAGAVLGATREVEGPQAAVLGARRGRTEDTANTTSRVIAVIIAAAVAATVLLTNRKKEEEEEA